MALEVQRNAPVPIFLNVYDLTPANGYFYWLGLGIYHSGLEAHGSEYAYGAHDDPTSGVFRVEPKKTPGFTFRQSIQVGTTRMTPREFHGFIEAAAGDYSGDSYHLIAKNCNHFTDDMCHRMTGRRIPGWINRLAHIGWIFNCLLPESLQVTAAQQEYRPVQQRATYAKLPKPQSKPQTPRSKPQTPRPRRPPEAPPVWTVPSTHRPDADVGSDDDDVSRVRGGSRPLGDDVSGANGTGCRFGDDVSGASGAGRSFGDDVSSGAAEPILVPGLRRAPGGHVLLDPSLPQLPSLLSYRWTMDDGEQGSRSQPPERAVEGERLLAAGAVGSHRDKVLDAQQRLRDGAM